MATIVGSVGEIKNTMATKSDIADLEQRTQNGFNRVADEVGSIRQDLRKLGEKVGDLGTKFDIMKKVTVDDHEKHITRLEHQVLHA